eukprot:Sdes_comp13956_c0_seq1m3347
MNTPQLWAQVETIWESEKEFVSGNLKFIKKSDTMQRNSLYQNVDFPHCDRMLHEILERKQDILEEFMKAKQEICKYETMVENLKKRNDFLERKVISCDEVIGNISRTNADLVFRGETLEQFLHEKSEENLQQNQKIEKLCHELSISERKTVILSQKNENL